MIDINAQIKKLNLVQDETDIYNTVFKDKSIYIENSELLPGSLLNKIKLYQAVIKELVEFEEFELLENINIKLLDKIYAKCKKRKDIRDIVMYFKECLENITIRGNS